MNPVFTYHLRSVLPGEFHVAAGLGRLVAMKFSWGGTIEVRHSADSGNTWIGNYLPSEYTIQTPYVFFNGVEFGLMVSNQNTSRRVLLTGTGATWSIKAQSDDETGLFPGGGFHVIRAAPNHWIFMESAISESGWSYNIYAKPSSSINSTAAFLSEETPDLSITIDGNISTATFMTNDGVPGMFNRDQSILLRDNTFERYDIPNLYGPSTAGIIRTPDKIVTFDGATSTNGKNWSLSSIPRMTPFNYAGVNVQQADTKNWTGLAVTELITQWQPETETWKTQWCPIATTDGLSWTCDDPSLVFVQIPATGQIPIGAYEALIPENTGAMNVYPVPVAGFSSRTWTLTNDGKIYIIHHVEGQTYIVEAVPFKEPTFWSNLRKCDEVQ